MFDAWKSFSIFWIGLFCLSLMSNPLSEILTLLGNSTKVGIASMFIPLVPEIFELITSNSFIKSCAEIIKHILSFFICSSVMVFAVLTPSNDLIMLVKIIFILTIVIYFTLALALPNYLLQYLRRYVGL